MRVVVLFVFSLYSCMQAKRSSLDFVTPQGSTIRFLLVNPIKVEILDRNPKVPEKIRFISKGQVVKKTLHSGGYWLNWEIQPLEPVPNIVYMEPQGNLVCNCYYYNYYNKADYMIRARGVKGELFEEKVTIEVASPEVYLEPAGNSQLCPSAVFLGENLYLLYSENHGSPSATKFLRWNGKRWNVYQGANEWQSLSIPHFPNNLSCPELLEWQGSPLAVSFSGTSFSNFTINLHYYNILSNSWGLVSSFSTSISSWLVSRVFSFRDFILPIPKLDSLFLKARFCMKSKVSLKDTITQWGILQLQYQ